MIAVGHFNQPPPSAVMSRTSNLLARFDSLGNCCSARRLATLTSVEADQSRRGKQSLYQGAAIFAGRNPCPAEACRATQPYPSRSSPAVEHRLAVLSV
jgi:hypothetical protein